MHHPLNAMTNRRYAELLAENDRLRRIVAGVEAALTTTPEVR